MVPLFTREQVVAAVSPGRTLEAVRAAFVAYAQGEWTMPPKVYVPAYPAGDFRAMPALGGGHALLKWINSFPGNPAKGLPTVSGVALLSSAEDGRLVAAFDAASVTALRTGAAAVLAAEVLGRTDAESAAVVGAGVNGEAVARTFAERGREPLLWDLDASRATAVAERVSGRAVTREEALGADLVATVTPGREIIFPAGSLRLGQHVSLMGADGPGKAEIAVDALAAGEAHEAGRPQVRLFADDWDQASHGGDLAAAVETGAIARDDVTELGHVLTGEATGRRHRDDVTIFDSTGLAIQDLAVCLAALEHVAELDLPTIEL